FPVFRFSGFPVFRFSGFPVFRFSGFPVFRFSGFPVFRFSGENWPYIIVCQYIFARHADRNLAAEVCPALPQSR
ncbi:hypothetical protein, partial [Sinisalibacter aestuarii]|uniref:hypothetical protein n=1 Tax=Sinisalibacter aestuarii TaxID=2949426 RepID=UPI002490B910